MHFYWQLKHIVATAKDRRTQELKSTLTFIESQSKSDPCSRHTSLHWCGRENKMERKRKKRKEKERKSKIQPVTLGMKKEPAQYIAIGIRAENK